jgi:hypothetical protein
MFFREFPLATYRFGTLEDSVLIQNISAYADIIDDIKDNLNFYQYYDIFDKRPDQVSFELYGDVSFYWTFFLMNDNLRRQGWPIDNSRLDEWMMTNYNNTVITTKNSLDNVFAIGDTITGISSTETGVIYKRVEDLGQLFIWGSKNFTNNEFIEDGQGNQVIVTSAVEEYNAVKHYLDADGNFVDIDPANGPGAQYTSVTYYDFISDENDKLRQIRVIKPEAINSVVSAFREAMRSQ